MSCNNAERVKRQIEHQAGDQRAGARALLVKLIALGGAHVTVQLLDNIRKRWTT